MYICVYICIDRVRPSVYLRSMCQARAWARSVCTVCISRMCVCVCVCVCARAVARVCLISSGPNYVLCLFFPVSPAPVISVFSSLESHPALLFPSRLSPAGKLSETVSSLTSARVLIPVRPWWVDVSFSYFEYPTASFRLLLTLSLSLPPRNPFRERRWNALDEITSTDRDDVSAYARTSTHTRTRKNIQTRRHIHVHVESLPSSRLDVFLFLSSFLSSFREYVVCIDPRVYTRQKEEITRRAPRSMMQPRSRRGSRRRD